MDYEGLCVSCPGLWKSGHQVAISDYKCLLANKYSTCQTGDLNFPVPFLIIMNKLLRLTNQNNTIEVTIFKDQCLFSIDSLLSCVPLIGARQQGKSKIAPSAPTIHQLIIKKYNSCI